MDAGGVHKMKLLLLGHDCRYAMEQICLSLFPANKPETVSAPFTGDGAVSRLTRTSDGWEASADITLDGRTCSASASFPGDPLPEPRRRQILRQSFYLAALQFLPAPPPWGALSGVRPTKLSTRHLLDGGTAESADRLLAETYFVSPVRRELCIEASLATLSSMSLLRPGDLSLYVGIPFCPTRCAYCSFVSQAISRAGRLLPPYLDALLAEIRFCGDALRKSGWRARTLYIGGGTPTILSAEQLELLMNTLSDSFDLSDLTEYTIEGGRPDTLTPEKFRLMRQLGCDRISINPQTMSDAVLRAVGRSHTAEDIIRSFGQARDAGFECINMDLIAGLPGDSPEGFRDSLERVLALDPENITVHTLARKRSSDLFYADVALPDDAAVGQMVDTSLHALRAGGYTPYYLYRQKYMSGNYENIGWCRNGTYSAYNIYMMEELHPILSMGSGGMSKLTGPDGKLLRFHNPKYPKEYSERVDTALADKAEFFRLLGAPH